MYKEGVILEVREIGRRKKPCLFKASLGVM
jgi:hypothetical protein